MATGVIYADHDNVVSLELTDDDLPVDLTNMTKVQVTIDGVTADSTIAPDMFELGNVAAGIIGLKFGALAGVTEAAHKIRLVIFDAANQAGIVWSHEDNLLPIVLRFTKD